MNGVIGEGELSGKLSNPDSPRKMASLFMSLLFCNWPVFSPSALDTVGLTRKNCPRYDL